MAPFTARDPGSLGVIQKTAWRMARRISEAMRQQNPHRMLTALWLQWILLGEQKRRNEEKAVVAEQRQRTAAYDRPNRHAQRDPFRKRHLKVVWRVS